MATPKQWTEWNKAMAAWNKKLTKWQKAHPEIDWLKDLCANPPAVEGEVTTESHGGDHPPAPPPKP